MQADALFALATLIGFLWYFFNRLHNDMSRIEGRLDKHITETHDSFNSMGARIDAMGARIDAMGTRIDQTQAIIIRMLESQGR